MDRDGNGSATKRSQTEIAERIGRARELITGADLEIQKALHDLRIARVVIAECQDDLTGGGK